MLTAPRAVSTRARNEYASRMTRMCMERQSGLFLQHLFSWPHFYLFMHTFFLVVLLCLDLMVQTCWSRKATFFFLLLLSFLVRDYRDSLQVIYFKPRHNGP